MVKIFLGLSILNYCPKTRLGWKPGSIPSSHPSSSTSQPLPLLASEPNRGSCQVQQIAGKDEENVNWGKLARFPCTPSCREERLQCEKLVHMHAHTKAKCAHKGIEGGEWRTRKDDSGITSLLTKGQSHVTLL